MVSNTASRPTLLSEMLAALTVAMLTVPQAIAFATIAGVPPQVGLYTAVIGGVLGSLLLRTPHLSVGPTNTMSLMVFGAVAAIGGPPEERLQTAHTLALLVGFFQLGMAVFRLGSLTRYVSHSVIIGFSAGVGVLIVAGQIGPLLGLHGSDEESHWFGLIRTADRLVHADGGVLPASVVIGLGAIALIVAVQRYAPRLPSYLLALVGATVVVAALGLTGGQIGFIGTINAALPPISLPRFAPGDLYGMILPAGAIAVIGLIDTVSVARTTSPIEGPRLNADRELYGLGITNAVGGLLSCIPSSVSYSRTALNTQAGAKTRWAGVATAAMVGLAVFVLAPIAERLPAPAIAAVLVVIGLKLVDVGYVLRVRESNRADFRACVVTLFATLVLPLHVAVLVGTLLSMALYIRQARRVSLTQICTPSGRYEDDEDFFERPTDEIEDNPILLLQAEGDLFFAAAEQLQDELDSVLRHECSVVILRLRRAHTLDATIMRVLERFALQLRERGGHLLLCGVRERMIERMELFKLDDTIPREHIFRSRQTNYDSVREAIAAARTLCVGGSSSASGSAEAAAG